MTHKPFQYFVDIRKIIQVILHVSTEQIHSFIFISVFKEEKVRKYALKGIGTVKINISPTRE